MSRHTRFRTQQLEREARASPVQWSEHSDDSSNEGWDEADGVERSPSRASESQDYEAEDQEAYIDYEHHTSGNRNHHEASRSPVLERRSINRTAAAPKNEYWSHRGSNESYHYENYASELQTDRQSKYEDKYKPKLLVRENYVPKLQTDWRSTYDNKYRPQLSEPGNNTQKILMGLLVIVTLIVGSLFVNTSEENSHTNKEDTVTAAVKKALTQYKNIPEDAVFQLSAGILNIVQSNPNRPSVFVLLHNNTGSGPFCLANAIGNIAMKYLESDEEGPLILNPDELVQNENIMKDYGWLIDHYKPHIERHRTVIVTDLQKFPGKMAMAFHFLCDAYSPIVPKSLFLFTLHVPNVHEKKVVEQAENAMHDTWKDQVDNDQRQALITRLTEDIISLPLDILHNDGCPRQAV